MSGKFVQARRSVLMVCCSSSLERLRIQPRLPKVISTNSATEFLQARPDGVQPLHLFQDRNSRRTGMDLGIRRGERHWSSEVEELRRLPRRARDDSLFSWSHGTEPGGGSGEWHCIDSGVR